MGEVSEQEARIAAGIRRIDRQFSDYLYEIKHLFDPLDTPSIRIFISEIEQNGNRTIVFIHKKGIGLRNDIRREVIALYASVYEGIM